jgi:hypothetical protein
LKSLQDQLKSLQDQFSTKAKTINSAGCMGNLSEGANVEVLGDASTGYIVNVVREKGEEAVRIPRSISAKLKAHQVSLIFLAHFLFTWIPFTGVSVWLSPVLCLEFYQHSLSNVCL